ncbi:MAG TPA: hypothetical protein VNR65_00315, partial [Geobacterales bacterium]|nr:hypothetical protein [Geobacterales bacterium]
SPVGQRLVCRVPQGHYQTTTMIAAVRLQGPQAPWLFEGPMDGELFLAWVKQGLVPVLRRDDVVIGWRQLKFSSDDYWFVGGLG